MLLGPPLLTNCRVHSSSPGDDRREKLAAPGYTRALAAAAAVLYATAVTNTHSPSFSRAISRERRSPLFPNERAHSRLASRDRTRVTYARARNKNPTCDRGARRNDTYVHAATRGALRRVYKRDQRPISLARIAYYCAVYAAAARVRSGGWAHRVFFPPSVSPGLLAHSFFDRIIIINSRRA